jgi:hypothetical protein
MAQQQSWTILEGVFSLWGFLIICVLGSAVGTAVATLGKNWRRAREHEHIAALKQSMIERGMSVEDIERVLAAGNKGAKADD